MPTSAEIAQQIQDQQNWFMQQNAMASQIGMSPMAYGGGGGGGVMPGHPGMSPMPGGFSFAPRNNGMAMGNRGSAMLGSAMGAAPMFASVMGGSSVLTNPISGFMAARGLGMGIGASMGAAGMMMAPLAAAGAAVGMGVQGMQQQSMVGSAISNYNFSNPQAIGGQGFNRQDAMAIGKQVRQLQMIPELMTSFEEITKILPQLKNVGVMQGVRDAAEFNKRMKESITTIREVSKILGTTMEDATEFFAHSRRVGFLGRTDQIRNTMNAQVTMSATGMDRATLMKMQEQAASAGTAIGGSRALAVEGVNAIGTRLGLQVRGNPGLQSTIQNITGMGGEEGIAAMSGMLLNAGQRISGTSAGRFMMAGFMKVGENGEVDLDEKLMERHRRGEISMDQVRQMGMRNMGNRDFVKKFEGRQTTLGQKFAGAGGIENMSQMLYGAFGEDEDAARVVMQNQYGMSEQMVDYQLQGMRDERSGVAEERRSTQHVIERNARRRMNSAQGLGTRVGKSISNVFEPLKQAGADLGNRVGSTIDEVTQDLMGDFVVTASADAKSALIEGLTGRDGKEAMKKAFGDGLKEAKKGGRGGYNDSIFSQALAMSTLAQGGTDINKNLTSQVSELMGYSGSGSLSTLVGEAWGGSELGSWVKSIGSNTTGRSAQGALNKYGEMFGLGSTGATQEGLQKRLQQMSGADTWTGFSAKPTAEMGAGAAAAAEIIRDLAANNEEYQGATEQKRFEMAQKAIQYSQNKDVRGARKAIDALGGSVDSSTAVFMGAQQHLKGSGAAAKLDKFGDLGAEGMDATKVAQMQRDASSDMASRFGADNAAVLMKSASARSVLSDLTTMKEGKDKDELKIALANGDAEAVRKLTGKSLTKEEMTAASRGFKEGQSMRAGDLIGQGPKAADVLATFDKSQRAGNSLALKESTSAAKEEIDKQFRDDKTPLGAAMKAYGAALSDLGSNLDDPSKQEAFKKAVDSTASAIEALKGQEKDDAMAKLDPTMRAAVARRAGTKGGLAKLTSKGSATVSEIAKATGLSEKFITDTLRPGGDGKTNIALDAATTAKLEKAAGQAGAAGAAIGGAEATNRVAKENQQLVLMKTMTEALIKIAGGPDKMDADVMKEYNSNKTNAANAGTASPGKK
jgi:hypothetical protein